MKSNELISAKLPILEESELILNPDGSLYHICLKDEHIADHVILVGDPERVYQVSKQFDHIDFKRRNREFIAHKGKYKGKDVLALSTGIGTDNIDIVVNELNAACNIDPVTRTMKAHRRNLNLIRIGTSGSLQEDIPVGTHLISEFSVGFDGLIHYYDYTFNETEIKLAEEINTHLKWSPKLPDPYVVGIHEDFMRSIGFDMTGGITATATGFYGPQGRDIGLKLSNPGLNESLRSFRHKNLRITNFEMETSALYGLGKLYGHQCCTCCMIIANRYRHEFLENHDAAVDGLIQTVLDRL